jgi:hypothetical protein
LSAPAALRRITFQAKAREWHHKSKWTFKKDLTHFASKDFNHNAKLLKLRWKSGEQLRQR